MMFPKNAIPTQFFDFDVYQFPDNELVEKMVAASFLNDTTKRNYFQSFQGRLKQLTKA